MIVHVNLNRKAGNIQKIFLVCFLCAFSRPEVRHTFSSISALEKKRQKERKSGRRAHCTQTSQSVQGYIPVLTPFSSSGQHTVFNQLSVNALQAFLSSRAFKTNKSLLESLNAMWQNQLQSSV